MSDLPDHLVETARRNIRYFVANATFRCDVDKSAALSCLDVIDAEVEGLRDLVAVLRSAVAACNLMQGPDA